ncbi:MAG TPA: secretin N-terminal domain-containing protein, partial [Candidatus Saccharimonadales bacterium]|nr:secretin N-terminal domain-containing protein [Candidatus Saccharimonadales bacterium]
MKTSTLLLVLVLAALTARAATNETPAQPGLTPAAEAAARAALQKAYEQGTAATNTAPGRAVPTRVVPGATSNVPATGTVTASPVNAATPAASPAPAPQTPPAPGLPAAAAPAPPAAPPATAAVPPVVPGRPATNALPPGFPGIVRNTNVTVTAGQTNRPTNQATPVPTIPGAPAPGAGRNVAGATPPGAGAGAGAVAVAGAATNQRPDPNEILPAGMIKFQEADLSQVLEIYQELTGRTVLKPASVPQAKISIKTQTELTRAEAVQALDTILAMNGISMVPQGEKFVKAVAEAQAGNQGMRFIDAPIDSLPESATYVTTVVQLTNATPNDILPVLTPFSKAPNGLITIPSTGMIVLRDYAENVKRMLEMIRRIDVVPQQEFESVVIPIKYALAGDIQQVLSSLTAGGGGGGLSVGRSQARTGLSGGGGLGGGLGGGGLG